MIALFPLPTLHRGAKKGKTEFDPIRGMREIGFDASRFMKIFHIGIELDWKLNWTPSRVSGIEKHSRERLCYAVISLFWHIFGFRSGPVD